MQLKEEYYSYEALRREHDTQIVSIAMEAGLRISPDQWSSLLYGDTIHKSHMQSIIDRLQTPNSFSQSIQELMIAAQRTNDPSQLVTLKSHFEKLTTINPSGTLGKCVASLNEYFSNFYLHRRHKYLFTRNGLLSTVNRTNCAQADTVFATALI